MSPRTRGKPRTLNIRKSSWCIISERHRSNAALTERAYALEEKDTAEEERKKLCDEIVSKWVRLNNASASAATAAAVGGAGRRRMTFTFSYMLKGKMPSFRGQRSEK